MKHDARACAALIAGGIDKYVMDAARDTIALNASMDGECLGWLRVAGPDACDLCVTCASGSTLYHTRTTAGGTPESTYHPGCRCGVVAVFGHGDKAVYVEPETGQRVKLDRADVMKRYEEIVAKGGAARRGKKRVKLLIDDFDDFERRIEGTTSIDEFMAIAAEADARIPAKMRKVPAYANLQKIARRKRDELKDGGFSGGAGKPPGRYGGGKGAGSPDKPPSGSGNGGSGKPPRGRLGAEVADDGGGKRRVVPIGPEGSVAIEMRQFGKKMKSHARDFGFEPADMADEGVRNQIINQIDDIIRFPDEKLSIVWRDRADPCTAYVKDGYAVVVDSDGQFITAFKEYPDGNTSFNSARRT